MKLTSDELRQAYATANAAWAGEHPSALLLTRLLEGEVTADERRAAVGHVAACSRCAEEVRVARPDAAGLSADRDARRIVRPAAWWRPTILLAAAAAVLVAGGLALRVGRPEPPATAYRSAPGPGLRSLLPEGVRLSRSAPVLRWVGAPAGTTVNLLLANERLDVLARFSGVKDSQLVVPPSVLSALPPGSKLVWRVTVVQPDGSWSDAASFVSVVE